MTDKTPIFPDFILRAAAEARMTPERFMAEAKDKVEASMRARGFDPEAVRAYGEACRSWSGIVPDDVILDPADLPEEVRTSPFYEPVADLFELAFDLAETLRDHHGVGVEVDVGLAPDSVNLDLTWRSMGGTEGLRLHVPEEDDWSMGSLWPLIAVSEGYILYYWRDTRLLRAVTREPLGKRANYLVEGWENPDIEAFSATEPRFMLAPWPDKEHQH